MHRQPLTESSIYQGAIVIAVDRKNKCVYKCLITNIDIKKRTLSYRCLQPWFDKSDNTIKYPRSCLIEDFCREAAKPNNEWYILCTLKDVCFSREGEENGRRI